MTSNTPDSKLPDADNRALLIRYYAGQSDPDEQARVARLIAELPHEQQFARAFEEKVIHGSPELTAQEVDSAIRAGQLYAAGGKDSARATLAVNNSASDPASVTTLTPSVAIPGSSPVGHRKWWRKGSFVQSAIVRISVVAAVCAVGWFGGAHYFAPRLDRQNLLYTTENGHRATIRLSDGSQVTLNVGSRLEVPADYVTGNRSVRLSGEALFTVTHNAGTPFTVTAGGRQTRVLGTSFIVRRYATDTVTLVAVREGKVAVGSTVLTAQQQVTVGNDGVSHVRAADASRFTFATGVLSFNNRPLADAIADLNRWYDADIRLGDDALRSRRITGKFSSGSLADLSELLELTFDVRVKRSGRTLTMYAR